MLDGILTTESATTPAAGGGMADFFGKLGKFLYNSDSGDLMGMKPESFSSVAGQLGAAIAPREDSWQSKIGKVAAQIGQAQIQAGLLKQQEKDHRTFLDQLFKSNPGLMSKMISDYKGASSPYSLLGPIKFDISAPNTVK